MESEAVRSLPDYKPCIRSRLAAFYFSISYGLFMYIWSIAIYLSIIFPPLIVLVLLYIVSFISPFKTLDPSLTASFPTPFKRWRLWYWFHRYFPHVKIHKTTPLDPNKPYIFATHPHGVLAVSDWLTFGTDYAGFRETFPGIDVRVLTLDINFKAPLLREYLLLHGVCSVSRTAMKTILSQGTSVMLAVGGGSESLLAKPGTAYDIILKRRRGFVKVALETGASLVPCFCFGENDLFSTINSLPPSSFMRKFQHRIEKLFGFTIPIAFGSGLFFKYGILPYSKPLDIVIGSPIKVEQCVDGNVGDARYEALIDKYHGMYVDALVKLFDENQEKYGKGAILNIVE